MIGLLRLELLLLLLQLSLRKKHLNLLLGSGQVLQLGQEKRVQASQRVGRHLRLSDWHVHHWVGSWLELLHLLEAAHLLKKSKLLLDSIHLGHLALEETWLHSRVQEVRKRVLELLLHRGSQHLCRVHVDLNVRNTWHRVQSWVMDETSNLGIVSIDEVLDHLQRAVFKLGGFTG